MLRQLSRNGDLWIAVAFIIMGILFYSSSQTYQDQSQVGNLSNLLAHKPFQSQLSSIDFEYAGKQISIAKMGYFEFVEFLIRKFAHYSIYFLLGLSWLLGLRKKMNAPLLLIALVAVLCSAGYAAMDEFHQSFTGGRSPLFQDVTLDTFGALCANIIVLLISGVKRLRGK